MQFALPLSDAPTVITAAFPFVPADLSIAHIASTYLPADITRRFWKVLGRHVPLVCATDVHSIQISTDGRTRRGTEALCADRDALYRRQLPSMGVECDLWLRTDHPEALIATSPCCVGGTSTWGAGNPLLCRCSCTCLQAINRCCQGRTFTTSARPSVSRNPRTCDR